MRITTSTTLVILISAGALFFAWNPDATDAKDNRPKLCAENGDKKRIDCLAREIEKLQAELKERPTKSDLTAALAGVVTKKDLEAALENVATKKFVEDKIPSKVLLAAEGDGGGNQCVQHRGGGGSPILQSCNPDDPQQKWTFRAANR